MKNTILKLALLFIAGTALINCQGKSVAMPMASSSLNSVYYDYDQAHLRSDMVSVMRGNANYLKAGSSSVVIEGHCDQRGSNEYNLALGQRRAQGAKNYLMNLGVATSRMRTMSFGEERPSCSSYDETCFSRNRRVDFRR